MEKGCKYYHFVGGRNGYVQSGGGCLRNGGHCNGKCKYFEQVQKLVSPIDIVFKHKYCIIEGDSICKSLIEAMGEIEKRQLENNNWDEQNGMLKALEILHNHLGASK